MFEKRGWECLNLKPGSISIFEECDLVQFTGGSDVTPALYGEENTASSESVERDIMEAACFAIAQRMDKPMAGICRGGQFLNVMCGGRMIQDVQGHASGREHMAIDCVTGKAISVTSTHHQMMVGSLTGSQLVACAHIRPGEDYDTEVLWYEDHRCLCFQPHPEFRGHDGCTDYYFELLERYFGM